VNQLLQFLWRDIQHILRLLIVDASCHDGGGGRKERTP
jgi:hypothetical protein